MPLSGHPLRRRVHHGGAANERLFAVCAKCSITTNGPGCRCSGTTRPREKPGGARRAHRIGHVAEAAELLAGAARGQRHPCGPINNYQQVFADPQVVAREMVVETEHRRWPYEDARISSQAECDSTVVTRQAPQLGEHTDEILAEAGFSEGKIAELRRPARSRSGVSSSRCREDAHHKDTEDTKEESYFPRCPLCPLW